MNEITSSTPIITLWMPWANWVAQGWKTIETRTHMRFACLKGKRIGIHAGLKWDKNALNLACPYLTLEQDISTQTWYQNGKWMAGGTILCTSFVEDFRLLRNEDSKEALIECETKRYGLVLKDIVLLNPPIPCRGSQGIWYLLTKEFK
jgi:hypothetical protein